MKTIFLCFLLISAGISTKAYINKPHALTEDQKIEKLIKYVAGLQNATFLRNGAEYPPAKAAEHLRRKYSRDRAKFSSAEEFVKVCGTVSNTSGKPYLIKFADGKTVKLGDLLFAELARMEHLQ